MATTSSGNFRRIEQLLAPEATVFASGVLGPQNGARLGNLFWVIYYFFPRRVEVTLGAPPRYTAGGWIDGVDNSSPEQLLTRGYDVHLDFGVGAPEAQQMVFRPLRPERAFRPEAAPPP